jgi:hypothetical protein
MAAETQYTANTGTVVITTANSGLDGSGTLGTVLTAGSNGTLIKSITVKAIMTTTEGMVRLFIYDGSTNTRLINEIHVPSISQAATTPTFEYKWNCDLPLQTGYVLKASTQTGDDFVVTAEGLDWTYFTQAVRPESTNFVANTGMTVISTANSNLDGTGTIGTVITAGASGSGYKGLRIECINIKAIQRTTTGMVRLYVYDGTNTRLLKEIFIPAFPQTGPEQTFQATALEGFQLQAGYSIKASTQNGESFAIIAEGNDWKYPSASTITNFTPASGTNTTSEELLHSLQVPAGLFSTGDIIKVYADLITTNNANNKTFRIYVNTSNTLTAATKLATVTYVSVASASIMRLFPVISATSLGCYGGVTQSVESQYQSNAGTTANVTVPNVTSTFWVLISCQKATGADTDTVQWSIVKKDNSYSL